MSKNKDIENQISIFQSKKSATLIILLFLFLSFLSDHFSNLIQPINEILYFAKIQKKSHLKIFQDQVFGQHS